MTTTLYLLATFVILPACFAAPKFMYPDASPCVLADFKMDFTLEYTEKGSTMQTVSYSLPTTGITVSGSCTSGTTHTLTLNYSDQLSFIFTIDAKTNITNVQITYKFNAATYFKDTKYTEFITVSSPPFSLDTDSNKDESYICYAHAPEELENRDTNHKAVLYIFFYDVQLQGFGVNGPKFGTEVECPADPDTTEPPTTSSTEPPTTSTTEPLTTPTTGFPPTTEPFPPNEANYTVRGNDTTCLYMEAQLWLSVQYLNSSDQNDTKEIPVMNAQSAGECGDLVNILFLAFPVEFLMAWVIERPDDSSSYQLQNITVIYNITEAQFPNAHESIMDQTFTAKSDDSNLWSTPEDAYFVCNNEQSIALSGPYEVMLYTQSLKMAAFHDGPDTPSVTGADYMECEADQETSSVVPIAVGAALAGLVVIVLIAYLVGRRRSQKGYESV